MTLKTITVDGIPVETTDAGATVIATLQQRLKDSTADLDKLRADNAALVTQVSTKDGEIAVLNKKIADSAVTPQMLDAAVRTRTAVIADAKKIAGDKIVVDGKTDAEIKRAAVEAKLGDTAKALDDAAINGAFLALAKDAKPSDPMATVIADGTASVTDWSAEADRIQAKRAQELRDAYLGPKPN